MTHILILLKFARLVLAGLFVATSCWLLSLDAEGLEPGAPASTPASPVSRAEAHAEPQPEKRRAQAVFELDAPRPKAADAVKNEKEKPALESSPPSTTSVPREGVHVYITVDGRHEDFGSVFVRSREGRHFEIRGGFLRPAEIGGRYLVRVPELREPPQAEALGDGREIFLVLRPEVERVIDAALQPHNGARMVTGVLCQRINSYYFEIKEILTNAEADKSGMGVAPGR